MAGVGVLHADSRSQAHYLTFELSPINDTTLISGPLPANITLNEAMPHSADLSARSAGRINTGHLLWVLTTSALVLQVLGYGDISVMLACSHLLLLCYLEGISPVAIITGSTGYDGIPDDPANRESPENLEAISWFLRQVKDLEEHIIFDNSIPDDIYAPVREQRVNPENYNALVYSLKRGLEGYTKAGGRELALMTLTRQLSETLTDHEPALEQKSAREQPSPFYSSILAPSAIDGSWHVLTRLSNHPSAFIVLSILVQEAINHFIHNYFAWTKLPQTIVLNQNLTDFDMESAYFISFWNQFACSFIPLVTTVGIAVYYFFR